MPTPFRSTPSPSVQFTYLLQRDFAFFIRKVFASVSPGDLYLHNWHVDAIAHHLELVMRGEVTRLIITMPPRYMKSICASVALPAYMLGLDPTKRIICVSYAQELATKHANDTRAIMGEPWYTDAFPHTRIDKSTEGELTTSQRGSRLATSVGGVLTGRGGNLLIVDDPIKPQDAMSVTARAKAKDWLENTLFTRLDDKVNDAIVFVMQRLHEDDPVGHLLEKGNWTHLNLPAIADVEQAIPIGRNKVFVRKPGELLHPEREPREAIERSKIELGSATFAAQYQQAPAPPEGNLIRMDWFKSFETPPPWEEGDTIFVSWDTAMKANDLANYSVGTVWHVKNRRTELYLIDVDRGRYDYPTLRTRVASCHKRRRANYTLIEDKGSGTSLLQDARHDPVYRQQKISVRSMLPEGDKVMRVARISPMIEAGVNGGEIPGQRGGVTAGQWCEDAPTCKGARSGPFACRRRKLFRC